MLKAAVKERPILFLDAMVRAILEGHKTQTRRVMKPQPDDDGKIIVGKIGGNRGVAYVGNSTSGGIVTRVPCPYGRPGDLLWVREAWWKRPDGSISYRADGNDFVAGGRPRYSPSIHMPRWASRITLRLTDVRVERVQDISVSDCIAEGLGYPADDRYAAVDNFKPLWDSINAARGYGWDVNPWVWVLVFESVHKEAA